MNTEQIKTMARAHELADRIEGMAGLGILSHIDNSGQLDLNGELSADEKAQIVAALRLVGAGQST